MAPTRKLTGAQATLFANICEHYIQAAEDECNDTPKMIPLFSWLSPQQRLKLVREVMIGVLCENEPLPPNTIQHNATYRALIETLFCELEVENDIQWDMAGVGDDLLHHDESDNSRRLCTPEERKEREYRRDLITHRAERNMNKMKRKPVGEFSVERELNCTARKEHLNDKVISFMKIFEGGHISIEERKSIRPLTDDERYVFRWRRLCDAALQEHFDPIFPLSAVNFDWRCQKLNNWYHAINYLLDTQMMEYGSPTDRALIFGGIDEYEYADPAKLSRIRAVENHVKILRKVYEATWDPKQVSIDQRCIYAVCATEKFFGYGHGAWVNDFITNCDDQGIDFKAGGNYQARLDIFRDMKDKHKEGLIFKFGLSESDARRELETWQPKAYQSSCKFVRVHCHGPGEDMYGFGIIRCCKTEDLKACSRCKVVMYCSAACQRADWPEHKKRCSKLAKERKDKGKIAEMAKR